MVPPDRDTQGDGSDVGEYQHDGRRRARCHERRRQSQCQSGRDLPGQGAVIPCAEPRLQSDGGQQGAQDNNAAEAIHS